MLLPRYFIRSNLCYRISVGQMVHTRFCTTQPGSGAGRGGGGGGSIREAGGKFGIMEAAKENQFFYNKQKEQLAQLKKHLQKEILFHEEQIARHEAAIKRWKEQSSGFDKQ